MRIQRTIGTKDRRSIRVEQIGLGGSYPWPELVMHFPFCNEYPQHYEEIPKWLEWVKRQGPIDVTYTFGGAGPWILSQLGKETIDRGRHFFADYAPVSIVSAVFMILQSRIPREELTVGNIFQVLSDDQELDSFVKRLGLYDLLDRFVKKLLFDYTGRTRLIASYLFIDSEQAQALRNMILSDRCQIVPRDIKKEFHSLHEWAAYIVDLVVQNTSERGSAFLYLSNLIEFAKFPLPEDVHPVEDFLCALYDELQERGFRGRVNIMATLGENSNDYMDQPRRTGRRSIRQQFVPMKPYPEDRDYVIYPPMFNILLVDMNLGKEGNLQ